jgi:hypothetical protein
MTITHAVATRLLLITAFAAWLLSASAGLASAASRATGPDVRALKTAASAPAGAPLAIAVTARNTGRARTKPTALKIVLSADRRQDHKDVQLTGSLRVPALKARSSRTLRAKLIVPVSTLAGRYYALACAPTVRGRTTCRAATARVHVMPRPGNGSGHGGAGGTGGSTSPDPGPTGPGGLPRHRRRRPPSTPSTRRPSRATSPPTSRPATRSSTAVTTRSRPASPPARSRPPASPSYAATSRTAKAPPTRTSRSRSSTTPSSARPRPATRASTTSPSTAADR